MPLKWKMYYWCCIAYIACYTLLIGAIFIMDYPPEHGKIDFEALLDILLLFAILFIPLVKPILSIRFITHLRKKETCKNRELILFTVFFVVNIILTAVFISILCNTFHPRASIWFLIICIMALIITSVYLIIFDMPLKKLVYNANVEDISVIGNDM